MPKHEAAAQMEAEKPKRLYFKTYLQVVRNSVGTEMFRNFFLQSADGREFDALDDGSNSCAFFVSSVLALFKTLKGPHGTVASTIKDLEQSGWQTIEDNEAQSGDVVVWEPQEFDGQQYEHIGFSIGDGRAVSTSWREKRVVEHDVDFGGNRAITHVFRYPNWEQL